MHARMQPHIYTLTRPYTCNTDTHVYTHKHTHTLACARAWMWTCCIKDSDLSTPSGPLTFSLCCSKSNTSGVRRLGAIGQTEEQLTKPMHAELQRYKQTAFCVCVYNHTLLFVFYFWFFLYASLSLCSPTNHHTYQHGVLHHNAI